MKTEHSAFIFLFAMVSYYAVAWCSILTLIPSLTAVVSFIILPSNRQSSVVYLYQEEAYPPSFSSNRNFSLSLVGGQLSSLVDSTTDNTIQRNSTNPNGSINGEEVDVVGGGTLGDIMASVDDTTTSSNTPTLNNNTTNNNLHNYIHDGLVTKEGGKLNKRFKGCNFTNMERIALTANGNLQRIFSSYYDEPVVVHVDSCTRRDNSIDSGSRDSAVMNGLCDTYQLTSTPNDNNDAIWDRVVYIQVHNQTICKATSIINVHSSSCIQLIEEGSVGLGQLFRYLNKLPTFSLLDAGRVDRSSSSGKIPTLEVREEPNDDIDDKFDGGMWRIYELQCEEMTCLIHEEFRSDAWEH